MLSSVVRRKRAVEVNIKIMPAFVRLRRMLAFNEELARKVAALEKNYVARSCLASSTHPVLRSPI
jgi:hypothetical protein